MAKFLIPALLLCLPLWPAEQPLAGVDTFGSQQVNIEQILKFAQGDIEQFSATIATRDMKMAEQAVWDTVDNESLKRNF